MASRLDTEARKVLAAREDYEQKRKAKAKAEVIKNAAEASFAQELEALGLKKVRIDLGDGIGEWEFRPSSTIRARVLDEDKALEAFEEEALVDDMVQPNIRKAPLNELVRTRLENGQPLPPGVDFSRTRFITATRR